MNNRSVLSAEMACLNGRREILSLPPCRHSRQQRLTVASKSPKHEQVDQRRHAGAGLPQQIG